MNNITFQTIRAVMVLGIAFFALANEVFAAPSLTPVSVNSITGTSATIVGHVSNPHKSTAVWFEIYNNFGAPMAVGAQPPLYDNGIGITFEYPLKDLNPGQTYSYRAGAMEGSETVYSPFSSFTTTAPKVAASTTTTYQPQPVAPVAVAQPAATAPKVAQAKTVVAPAKQVTTTTVTTKEGFTNNGNTNTAPVVITKEGFSNGNSATVIGSSNNLFPSTLIGWLLLILAILVVALIGRMIFESTENRRKTHVEIDTETE